MKPAMTGQNPPTETREGKMNTICLTNGHKTLLLIQMTTWKDYLLCSNKLTNSFTNKATRLYYMRTNNTTQMQRRSTVAGFEFL